MKLIITIENNQLEIEQEQGLNPKQGVGAISSGGVRKLATVDIEKYESEQSFVSAVLDEGRLEQGYNWLKENNKPQDQSSTGDFIRWIFNDVVKECSPEMKASNIEEKNLGKLLAAPAKKWYFARLNQN